VKQHEIIEKEKCFPFDEKLISIPKFSQQNEQRSFVLISSNKYSIMKKVKKQHECL